jgi:hypothetical protein
MNQGMRIATLVIAAALIVCIPAVAGADNLIRFFPGGAVNGFYSDNVPISTQNPEGDFGANLVAGFYLDLTSPARHASLSYTTLAQLLAQHSSLDRAGKAQFVRAQDDESWSNKTKLHLHDTFLRASPVAMATVGTQGPEFNGVWGGLLLARADSMINHLTVQLSHDWTPRWSTQVAAGQETLWSRNDNNNFAQWAVILQTYKINRYLIVGPGYRFYDFRFTVSGRPGVETHWPYFRVAFTPVENLLITGIAGPLISYTFGTDRQKVEPGGRGTLAYTFLRGRVYIIGGQEPALVSGLAGAGTRKFVRGGVRYEFSRRLTGFVNGGYIAEQGGKVTAQGISYAAGVTYRENRWLTLFARYQGIRVTRAREAVSNYYIVGVSFAFEAFRWSF